MAPRQRLRAERAPVPVVTGVRFRDALGRFKRRHLKGRYLGLKARAIRALLSYTPAQLESKLAEMGVSTGDTILMHCGFSRMNGFSGTPGQVIDSVLRVLGPGGNLLMMSMAYRGSSYDYVKSGACFDPRTTVSRMGIASEMLRRRQGVVRSRNPLHPVLALGPKADWLIAGHEELAHSCGSGSPFEKLLELSAKVLFFDVSTAVFTFTHYLEHRFRSEAPVAVYEEEPLDATVLDARGNRHTVRVYVFSEEARESRDLSGLFQELKRAGYLKKARIGNTKLTLVGVRNALNCAERLVRRGEHFYSTQRTPLRP
jgi:aminoglycoside 3-N-acetyltransferase